MNPTRGDTTDWRVILRGAACGLAVIVPVTIVRAILDRDVNDLDHSGWMVPLFVLILVAYALAGWVAGRGAPAAPLVYGALAGLGSVVLWIPIRVVIWAVREQDRGLFGGTRAALPPGQLVGALVLGAAIGMVGALLGARGRRGVAEPAAPTGSGT